MKSAICGGEIIKNVQIMVSIEKRGIYMINLFSKIEQDFKKLKKIIDVCRIYIFVIKHLT